MSHAVLEGGGRTKIYSPHGNFPRPYMAPRALADHHFAEFLNILLMMFSATGFADPKNK